MKTVELDTEGQARITELRDDEQFRLVIARTGEYGVIYQRDPYSGKTFPRGVNLVDGLYRTDFPWNVAATTWEGLAYAWARNSRHVHGKFVIAYKATSTEDHIEI